MQTNKKIKIENDKSEFLRQVKPIHFKNEKDLSKELLPKGIHYFREEGQENDDRIRLYRIDNMYTNKMKSMKGVRVKGGAYARLFVWGK